MQTLYCYPTHQCGKLWIRRIKGSSASTTSEIAWKCSFKAEWANSLYTRNKVYWSAEDPAYYHSPAQLYGRAGRIKEWSTIGEMRTETWNKMVSNELSYNSKRTNFSSHFCIGEENSSTSTRGKKLGHQGISAPWWKSHIAQSTCKTTNTNNSAYDRCWSKQKWWIFGPKSTRIQRNQRKTYADSFEIFENGSNFLIKRRQPDGATVINGHFCSTY